MEIQAHVNLCTQQRQDNGVTIKYTWCSIFGVWPLSLRLCPYVLKLNSPSDVKFLE